MLLYVSFIGGLRAKLNLQFLLLLTFEPKVLTFSVVHQLIRIIPVLLTISFILLLDNVLD